MSTTLIQLIGGQTLPNLFPVFSLRPSKVVHLISNNQMAKKAENLKAALILSGYKGKITSINIGKKSPTIAEMKSKIDQVLSQREDNEQFTINITGGTKQMSIGAYMSAWEKNIPSLYVDADTQTFISADTGNDPIEYQETPYSQRISLDIFFTAHGQRIPTEGETPGAFLALAKAIYNRGNPHSLFLSGEVQHRMPEFNNDYDYLRIAENYIENLPNPILICAITCGYRVQGNKLFLPNDQLDAIREGKDNKERVKSTLQKMRNFLCGSWWELIVYDVLKNGLDCSDIRWSAEAKLHAPDSTREEDILALSNNNLICVSCKLGGGGGEGLLKEVDYINQKTKSYGGIRAIPILAVYKQLNHEEAWQDVERRARDLNVEIVTKDTLPHLCQKLVDRYKCQVHNP